MARATQIEFTYREIVEALIKHHGIHDGIWGLHVSFGLQGANVSSSPGELVPAAIVGVVSMGLQKFEEESSISLDASKVNPRSQTT